jgi:hypothetical protein
MSKTPRRAVRAFITAVVALCLTSAAHAQDGIGAAFDPGLLAQGVTGLFAVATLLTGAAALFGNVGWSLLVRTGDFVVSGSNEVVKAPNVRGWGVRQLVAGAPLWAALLLGDQVLFQVGLACVLLRQALDIVLYLLDGTPRRTALFFVAAVPTAAAFASVL